jgi:hypothetical protein
MRTRHILWAVVAIGGVTIAAAALIILGGTPTTTGYVVNDTARAVTLDGCSDSSVTVSPSSREQIAPFQEPNKGCTVFSGASDLGRPDGCLYMSETHGQVVRGTVARVSQMRRSPGQGCP